MLSSSLAVASSPVEEQLAMSPAPTSRAGGSAVTCPVGVIHVLPGENGLWSSVHVVSSSSAARAGTLARRPRRDRRFIRKGPWRRGVKAIGSDHPVVKSCARVLRCRDRRNPFEGMLLLESDWTGRGWRVWFCNYASESSLRQPWSSPGRYVVPPLRHA